MNVTDMINRAGNRYAYIVRKDNLIDAEWHKFWDVNIC